MATIRTVSLIAVALYFATTSRADEPPSWMDFEVVSDNGQYVAEIKAEEGGGHSVSVFYKDRGELYWSGEYVYDGYAWGELSNDGSTFAYISFWYYEDEPVVYMYREGRVTGSVTGEEFGIPGSKLKDTVSHRLWLCEDCGEHFRFMYPEGGQPVLEIYTIDGNTQSLVLDDGGVISVRR